MGKSILILEDNQRTSDLLETLILKNFSEVKIYTARSVKEALLLAKGNGIDLLILDVNLEEKDTGIDFAEELRKEPSYAFTWILFLSAYPHFMTEAMRRSHCYEYMVKPINPAHFISLLTELLSRRVVQDTQPVELLLKMKQFSYRIPIYTINYIEAVNRICVIHTTKGQVEIPRLALQAIHKQLPSDIFIQCHKSYIVNIRKYNYLNTSSKEWYLYVYDKSTDKVPNPKETLPVGQTFREKIRPFFDINTMMVSDKNLAPEAIE